MIEMIRFIVNYILMYRKDSGGGLYNCWKPSVPLSARWGDEKKLLGITSKMNDELFYQAEGKTAVGQKENGGFRYYIDSLSTQLPSVHGPHLLSFSSSVALLITYYQEERKKTPEAT
jgi:hypothetical protein